MKQGSFRAVRHAVFLLFVMIFTTSFVLGDSNVVDYRAVIVEAFRGDRSHEWSFGGKTYSYDFDWALDASKFATSYNNDPFPKQTYVEAWPTQVYGTNRNGDEDLWSYGIWGKFDRRGYNWIDIYPVVPDTAGVGENPEPFEIPMPGRIRSLDLWVWGSNLNYTLEAYFRDYNGIIYAIDMGSIAHRGWKNLSAQIPSRIPQEKRILPHFANLSFVKFRVWTGPMERVDNFYIYLNQFKVLTDTFEMYFDGDELADPATVRDFWADK